MALVIGLTGGIAAGKSTCSDYLIGKDYRVFDTDAEVKRLYSNNEFLEKLKKMFPNVFTNGVLNKNLLRVNVFSNPKEIEKIEKLIHPIAEKKCDEFISSNSKEKVIFLDVPLLFEADWFKKCDKILSIICDLNIRKRRYIDRGGIIEIFDNVVSRQLTDKERIERSDYIISNDGTIEDFFDRIDQFIDIVKS